MRLLQLSDTHFGTERPAVLAALEHAIAALSPQLLLLCGDITQRARRGQFDAARAFLQRLPQLAVLALPGNHDLPLFNLLDRGLRPYAQYERVFGAREQRWREGPVLVLGVDATHPKRHKHGRLPLFALRERLSEARAEVGPDGVVVAAAHQPLWTAWEEDRGQVLRDARAAAELLATLGVDVVLSGHVHVPLLTTTAPAFPQLPRHFVLSGSGTAVSWRFRPHAPNSFNLLDIEPGSVWGMQYDYEPGAQSFVAVRAVHFVKTHGSWLESEAHHADDPNPLPHRPSLF